MPKLKVSYISAFLICLGLVLIIHGAVPFLMTPSLGQAVWLMGFSQSFVNESLLSIYAHNIGAPEPAPIAFGLSGAWVAGLFIRLGFSAPDAYSAMVAIWVSLSFGAAYGIARHFSVKPILASFSALVWLLMPVVWNHAGYSMLSMGIALQSLYFLAVLKVLHYSSERSKVRWSKFLGWFGLYPLVCILAVFMDGYSFIFFAVGSSIFAASLFLWVKRDQKKNFILWAFPVHMLSFVMAYGLYASYVGQLEFSTVPIDFFRGWGVDLSFLVVPTKGVHWLPDIFGISVERSSEMFFGDASVWITTFCLPLLVAAGWAIKTRAGDRGVVAGLILVAVVAFYLSLGPSLKVNSTKPVDYVGGPMMPEVYAVAPTGSAFIYEHVPGLKNMRASYRWSALGIFAAWLIVVLALSWHNRNATIVTGTVLLFIVAILNLPHPSRHISEKINNRDMFLAIKSDLVEDIQSHLISGDKVAFLPWRNDFLINYLASKLDIITYNIGGDKNFAIARESWPEALRKFPMGSIDAKFVDRIVLLFSEGHVDAVVLPYIDMLWAAHRWPPPIEFRENLSSVVEQLKEIESLIVEESEFYAVVRLKEDRSDLPELDLSEISQTKSTGADFSKVELNYPFDVQDRSEGLASILAEGWHKLENRHVWSKEEALLRLPVPSECKVKDCRAVLRFYVFAASEIRPVKVMISIKGDPLEESQSIVAKDSKDHQVLVSLAGEDGYVDVAIRVPDATSPKRLGQSVDARTLGVALKNISLTLDSNE